MIRGEIGRGEFSSEGKNVRGNRPWRRWHVNLAMDGSRPSSGRGTCPHLPLLGIGIDWTLTMPRLTTPHAHIGSIRPAPMLSSQSRCRQQR
jgi:hypothetical protein